MPITPLCTSEIAVKPDAHGGLAGPVRCKRWSCEWCHESNRRRVIAIGRAARPNGLLTLTVNSKHYDTPEAAAEALKHGLRLLRLRLKRHPRFQNFEFLAVFEKHKSGYPHLHLLIKGSFIPWKILRSMWEQMTGSYQVHITKISSLGQAALYCAKYIGKDLSSFPGCKRWWRSHGFSSESVDDYQAEKADGQWGRLTGNWHRFRFALAASGYTIETIGPDRIRFTARGGGNDPPSLSFAIYGATGANQGLRYGWQR